MTITNLTQKTILATQGITADNPFKRMKGLLGRDSLGKEEALVIKPCQSVHMLFMRFTIDVVFVNHKQVVVGLCSNLLPFRFSPIFFKSACAIELPAGTIIKSNTQLGDQLSF